MNLVLKFLSIIILGFNDLTLKVVGDNEFIAMSSNSYTLQLHLQMRNEYEPSESDPALEDASVRQRICDAVTSCPYYFCYDMKPVVMTKIFTELRDSYGDIFFRFYTPTTSSKPYVRYFYPYEYTNFYKLQEFQVLDNRQRCYKFKEYVFACVLRHAVAPFGLDVLYVSKEYNLSERSYRAGRFVIKFNYTRTLPYSVFNTNIFLAEEPAEAFAEPNFNVEVHYLRIREYRRPVENHDLDPICQLVLQYHRSQEARLCAVVLMSSHMRRKIKYPLLERTMDCPEKEVSFRTKEGISRAAGNTYKERMVRCSCRSIDAVEAEVNFLISRAYKSHEVFVYEEKSTNGVTRRYLENLTINVDIVNEPFSQNFHDVED